MTDILDNLINDGSDNEDIKKLFPKCKPKGGNDVNLNKIHEVERYVSLNSNAARLIGIDFYCGTNENKVKSASASTLLRHQCYMEATSNSLVQANQNERSLPRDLELNNGTHNLSNRGVNFLDNDNKSGNYRSELETDISYSYKALEGDNSVVSAYDHYIMDRNGHNKISVSVKQQQNAFPGDVVYDDSLDVGYRVPSAREEFKLRESRIEIAGGREVFSSSKSRPSKKRFSDEMLYHRPSDRELKRHSGEVLYDEQLSRYHIKSVTRHSSGESQCQPNVGVSGWAEYDRAHHWNSQNKVLCDSDEMKKETSLCGPTGVASVRSPSGDRDIMHLTSEHNSRQSQKETFVLKGQRSGMFIYETVMCGTAEVVYDDIGDWVDQADGVDGGRQDTVLHVQSASMKDGSDAISSFLENQGSGYRDIKRLNISTEAVNSEDFMSEREDGGSSQEGASSPSSVGGKGLAVNDLKTKRDVDSSGDICMHTPDRDLCPSSSEDMDTESVQSSPDRKSVARLIGSLPIAQYEGSPRRYGPRPGHPQRIATSNESVVLDAPATNSLIVTNFSSQVSDVAKLNEGSTNGGFHSEAVVVEDSKTISKNANCDDEEAHAVPDCINLPFPLSDYNYQYEESETRKVLEEFYLQDGLCARLKEGGTLTAEEFSELEYRLYRVNTGNSYVGRRLAQSYIPEAEDSPKRRQFDRMQHLREHFLANSHISVMDTLMDSLAAGKRGSTLSQENVFSFNMDCPRSHLQLVDHDGETVSTNPDTEDLGETEIGEQVGQSRNFTLSPETTECDSNDVESEVSMENEGSLHSSNRQYSSMPVLEDGLSSGHTSEGEKTVGVDGEECDSEGEVYEGSLATRMMRKQISEIEKEIARRTHKQQKHDHHRNHQHFQQPHVQPSPVDYREVEEYLRRYDGTTTPPQDVGAELEQLDPLGQILHGTPPPPAPLPHRASFSESAEQSETVTKAINEIKQAIRKTKTITLKSPPMEKPEGEDKPIWVLRPSYKSVTCQDVGEQSEREIKKDKHEDGHEEDECDTDQETDRLLGKQRTEENTFFDDKRAQIEIERVKERGDDLVAFSLVRPCTYKQNKLIPSAMTMVEKLPLRLRKFNMGASEIGQFNGNMDCNVSEARQCRNSYLVITYENDLTRQKENKSDLDAENGNPVPKKRYSSTALPDCTCSRCLEKEAQKKKGRTKEVLIHEPAVLIEGVLFRARYLGSTQLVCEGQPTKATRMMQAEEAVSRIKAPEGETQPSTEVDLFISTEKIMVLNTDLKEIMMDHALRTISYIADIGDLVVLMARRRVLNPGEDPEPKMRRTPKMICHVFESEEAQFIAQSIGQAFQVAYMEFLKANGIEDHSFVKEMDYQEVLNSQEIFGDELEMFAKKEMQKEVIVPKFKNEIFGVVIVESGWGSMLPTVVIANLSPSGAAARCGQLNIGDQIIAINGISLVGLPLSTCQHYIKNTKNQTVVKLTVVPCAPVVEVKIKRPDTKYQLGFSVQNGVICSLLRGGIAERGGVRVGHRIIEINGQSVVAVPHERIVNLLATSVGEIHMKTMPTSMFRLLTGQEAPLYI